MAARAPRFPYRWSPNYGRFPRWPSVKDQGHASLKDTLPDAEPVNDVPIAGFARPLQAPRKRDTITVEALPPDWVEVIEEKD